MVFFGNVTSSHRGKKRANFAAHVSETLSTARDKLNDLFKIKPPPLTDQMSALNS